jgi:hypothetical protein
MTCEQLNLFDRKYLQNSPPLANSWYTWYVDCYFLLFLPFIIFDKLEVLTKLRAPAFLSQLLNTQNDALRVTTPTPPPRSPSLLRYSSLIEKIRANKAAFR